MSVLIKGRLASIANKDGKKLFHPQAVSRGVVSTREIGDEIASRSAMTRGDVLSVVDNMIKEIKRALKNGQSVKLDGIGSLYITVKSNGNGVEDLKDLNVNQIERAHVVFREARTRKGAATRAALSDEVAFELAKELQEQLNKIGVTDKNVPSGDPDWLSDDDDDPVDGGDDGGNDGGGDGGNDGGGGDDLLG